MLGEALKEEIESGRVVAEGSLASACPRDVDGTVLPRKIYLKSLYYSERDVARRVRAILDAPRSFAVFDAEKAIA